MFGKNAMKYPALVAGVIMFALFLADPKTKVWWNSLGDRFIPSTCKALVDRVSPKSPENWSIDCPGTSRLVLSVESELESSNPELRKLMYRSMANTLKSFAVMANPETLQNLKVFEIVLKNDDFSILGKTDGQAMAKLGRINGTNQIAQHLRLTVKVKEQFK